MGITISITRNLLQIHPIFRTHAWATITSYVNSWSNSTLLHLVKMLNSPNEQKPKNKQAKNFRKIFGLFWIDVHTQKQLMLTLVFPILKYRFWAKDNLVKNYWRQITGIPLAVSFRLNANQSFWKVCMMFGLRKLLSYYLHAQNKFGRFIDVFFQGNWLEICLYFIL